MFDTALVLESVLVEGMESTDGRAAVRRMNQMHGSYDISNDDLRYVLSTFVVTPQRESWHCFGCGRSARA